MIIKANTNTDNPTTPGGDVSSRQTHTPRGADTFGFNGIHTSQHTRAVCSPAIRSDLPRSTRELPVRAPAGRCTGRPPRCPTRSRRRWSSRDRHRRVEHLRAGTGQRRHPGPRPGDGDRRRISSAIASLGAPITAPTPRTARQGTPRRDRARRRGKTSTSPSRRHRRYRDCRWGGYDPARRRSHPRPSPPVLAVTGRGCRSRRSRRPRRRRRCQRGRRCLPRLRQH